MVSTDFETLRPSVVPLLHSGHYSLRSLESHNFCRDLGTQPVTFMYLTLLLLCIYSGDASVDKSSKIILTSVKDQLLHGLGDDSESIR